MRLASTLRASTRVPLLQSAKAATATVVAWFVASIIFPAQIPVFAAIAALLVVQPSVNQSVGKAVERSLGVIIGVLVAYGVGLVFGRSSWIVLLAIVLAIFVAWILRLTPGSANQVPISAMLVLSIGAASPDYAFERIIETVIGAAIAIVVNIAIVPPVLLAPFQQSLERLATEIASTLDRLATALTSEQSSGQLAELMVTARLLRSMQEKAQSELAAAHDSLAFNPRAAKAKRTLATNEELFKRMPALVTRTIGMVRALHDHYDDELRGEPTVRAIADELSRASHDLLLLAGAATGNARRHDGEPEENQQEPQALTAPLVVSTPHPSHWVLLGSLLEDLRRIHEEIAAD
jgi:uncharacterized membrane protein YgaE (UPF0421/DUF939 family)